MHCTCFVVYLLTYYFKGGLWDQKYVLVSLHPYLMYYWVQCNIQEKCSFFFLCFVQKSGSLSCEQDREKKSCLLISERIVTPILWLHQENDVTTRVTKKMCLTKQGGSPVHWELFDQTRVGPISKQRARAQLDPPWEILVAAVNIQTRDLKAEVEKSSM